MPRCIRQQVINIKSIMCPTDMSHDSDKALRYAVALARAYGARLFILTWAEDIAPARTLTRLEVNENLRKMVASALSSHLCVGDVAELDWEFILAEGASAAEAITREAAARSIDLIVMRSRRRFIAAALLGSTAEAVSRTAPCPVLITHPKESEWVSLSSGEIGLERVLVAHDFSDHSELALSYGLSLAQEYKAELHLLHVSKPPPTDAPEITWSSSAVEDAYQKAARRLQKAVPPEVYLWCQVRTVVRWGTPHHEVLSYAEENKIDLICIGAHGGGSGVKPILGSTTDRILRRAPCPVLVVRSAQACSL